jgi:hypothetical protein
MDLFLCLWMEVSIQKKKKKKKKKKKEKKCNIELSA